MESFCREPAVRRSLHHMQMGRWRVPGSGLSTNQAHSNTLSLSPTVHTSWVKIRPITHLGVLYFSIKAIGGDSIRGFRFFSHLGFEALQALSNKTGSGLLGMEGLLKIYQCRTKKRKVP